MSGVDPSPAMVEQASQRVPQAEVKLGSAEDIPFPDAAFTVVINVSSYHHGADPEAGFAEVLRVLASGGHLLIAEHRHKRRSGHGMTIDRAEDVTATLLDLGLPAVDRYDQSGAKRVPVVSATAPCP